MPSAVAVSQVRVNTYVTNCLVLIFMFGLC